MVPSVAISHTHKYTQAEIFKRNGFFCNDFWISVNVFLLLLDEKVLPNSASFQRNRSFHGKNAAEYFANMHIQGVHQNCFHFCLLNFSASYWSRNSILDIFNSPFNLKIPILLLFGQILTKILPKYYKEVILKVDIFLCITESRTGTLRITQKHLWALKSANEQSWALMSTQKSSWALMGMLSMQYEC